MNNKSKYFGIIAITVVFILASCGNGTTGPVNGLSAGLYLGAPGSLTNTSAPLAISGEPGATVIDKALSYINGRAGATYTMLIAADIPIAGSGSRALEKANAKLTLIGMDTERKISLTSAGMMFYVGSNPALAGIELTLGENITLEGFATNNNCVVHVDGASFAMLPGSKITRNISSGTAGATHPAVYVRRDGSFTMQGGAITGNSSTSTTTSSFSGGLFVDATGTTVTLAGGSITGNSGFAGDVSVSQNASSIDISGNAEVGTLTLSASNVVCRSMAIASDWTGSVTILNLRGANDTAALPIANWVNKSVLTGTVNTITIGQITLGNFIYSNVSTPQHAISDTHGLNATGVLIVKP